MNKRALSTIALLGATGALVAGGVAVGAGGNNDDQSASLAAKIDPSRPRNVILLVGDGMGDSEVTIGRYYGKGAAGRLNMDALPFRGSSLHYVLRAGDGPRFTPNYAGDSAPTATAWSTGKRTQDNRVSQGPSSSATVVGDNDSYRTYMEIARDLGKATGNVSTAEITDATPAAPSSHMSQRDCQGPDDTRRKCASESKENGGLGSIAEQQVDEGFDLVLGGGRARYRQTLDGSTDTVIDYAQDKGYRYVSDANGLRGVTSLAEGEKLLGLFHESNMTTEFAPLFARTDSYRTANPTLDPSVDGGGENVRCQEHNRPAGEPSLAAMTQKAIDLLKNDPDGFTLQAEGASIDKRDHSADLCGQIGEMLQFDAAIGVAQEFQRNNPDTLIIVTADHSHTSQIISSTARPATGASYATVQTADGAPLRVTYGTKDTGDAVGTTGSSSQEHTGAQVPVWASGPQAANVQGTIDQTDIFAILNGKIPSKIAGAGTTGPAGPAGTPGLNGTDGTDGADGAAGPVGGTGATGTNGVNGLNGAVGPGGTNGLNGKDGTPGPAGTNGANGKDGVNGVDGRDAKVSCRLSGSKSVRCTVAYASARAKNARLMRRGHTVATGKVSRKGAVTLKAKKKLARGSYKLVAGGRSAKLSLR